MLHPPAPNFFVVGAPRAGTTSLYHYLAQHPGIFMTPVKEPAFFAPEVLDMTTSRDHGLVLDWDNYLQLFDNAGDESARGEGSTSYLASEGAAAAIGARIPNARIIMILRNPLERLLSYYGSARDRGTLSFGDWIELEARREAERGNGHGRIRSGMYAQHLKRYQSVFPSTQIRVYLYEDFRDRVDDILADIFAFLGVDSSYHVNTTQRHNVSPVVGSRRFGMLERVLPPLKRLRRAPVLTPTPAEHAQVAALYHAEIRELQDLIGRDLAAWLVAA